ncbi:hypothetical protein EV677_2170 [Herminiimonas fonticola]|uniref:Uncharacterized protein n=1 Tax=Herminiimonas fonticola TaxID=303380 RepID=A0A4R6G6H6_9BURK|nr:hypothetical protein EV677_2170 [Herminiimonas fonticola]
MQGLFICACRFIDLFGNHYLTCENVQINSKKKIRIRNLLVMERPVHTAEGEAVWMQASRTSWA